MKHENGFSGNFVRRMILPCLLLLVASVSFAQQRATEERIRLMAANITSGNLQSYDPGEGTRIFKGLKPDIVMIQEFNYGDNSSTTIQGWVESTFGAEYTYYREGGNEQIPNGVISRWPMISSGEWNDSEVSNRDFAWAKIDIPGDTDLWAISVHLLTSGSGVRNSEAIALRNYIQANVPAGDFLVIAGDFNTDSRSESCISTLSSVVYTGTPHPADQNGNDDTNASRSKPYDWVLVDSDLNAYKTPLTIGSSTYTNGLVFDSRVYTPLSEVSPVLYGDSGATNMQHMAVVKDFLVPAGPPSPSLTLSTDPVTPRFDMPTDIVANINSTIGVDAATAKAYWRIGTTGDFTEVALQLESGTANSGSWRTASSIPAQPSGTRVEYYAEAANTDGTMSREPDSGADYYISFEPSAPVISAGLDPAAPVVGQDIRVTAQITADAGIDSTTVKAPYSATGGQSGTLEMTLVTGTTTNGTWRSTVPISGLAVGEVLSYHVEAEDVEGRTARNPNTGEYSVTIAEQPQEIDISGWTLTETDAGITATFPSGTKIQAGGYLVMTRDADQTSFESTWGALPAGVTFVNGGPISTGSNGMVINGGEIFELRDSSNTLIDGPTDTSGVNAKNASTYREATNGNSWVATTDTAATPGDGPYGAAPHGIGVVITEFADPADGYLEAYVELYYDAAAPTPTPTPTPTPSSETGFVMY
ncbi:lamin tail domain-containing protein [bacterium]|nr:lamin tail domain-containing protein [bacterium]